MNELNEAGKEIGYWELYNSNGEIMYKGNYSDGELVGYWEWYHYNGELCSKTYYI
tara:strand:+ start:434 stop:598 length:165 start_codon:yes stop_codon:yes gene_type:complete